MLTMFCCRRFPITSPRRRSASKERNLSLLDRPTVRIATSTKAATSIAMLNTWSCSKKNWIIAGRGDNLSEDDIQILLITNHVIKLCHES